MITKKLFRSKSFLLTVFLDIVLFLAVVYLMNYVQYMLNEDVRINLTEIVTQNKDVINSKLSMELNNLELDAKQISDRYLAVDNLSEDAATEVFLEYAREKNDGTLIWAWQTGNARTGNGQELKLSGRTYFKLGLEGIPNISDRMISRVNGEDVFLICVPLTFKGEVIGTIQKQYTPQEMYSLCSVSLFSEQGLTSIINSQGYILIGSEKSTYNRESDNYYRIMYLTDPEASKQLEDDIQSGKSGFMQTLIEDRQVFFAYTPIERIHDWYLISSIPTDAVSPNANMVVKLFYFVLFTLALLFALSWFFYLTLKRKQQLKLERIAFVDEVTDGDSFTKFTVDMQNILQLKSETEYHICALDIDNFKYINSAYSFDIGNHILKTIYYRYSQLLLQNERISRVNADHFVLLLEDVSMERLRKLIELELYTDDIKIYLSAGLYRIVNPSESVNLMVDKANAAAHKGKGKQGKNIEFYSDTLFQKAEHCEKMKRAMEAALEHHEIIPFFQPKVDINTGELVGAEALARWRMGDGKLISPGEFIPVCEQTGLITAVDIAIFEKTLQFIRTNLSKGIKCAPISVNFSRLHLLNNDFVKTIIDRLDQYQVPSNLIELELTETVIYDNYQTISLFIQELHHHGLKVSMDDFGSGHSSLGMLKDVEIDVLKLDRGFLLDTESSGRQKIIFGSIVRMAHELDIKVVVEGVETLDNVNIMKEYGCNYAQGFFYAKPMDTDAFEKVYEKGYLCTDKK